MKCMLIFNKNGTCVRPGPCTLRR